MLNYRIITDLADTDLYKLTMLKWVIEHYPEARARYELKFRKDVEYTAEDLKEINRQLRFAGRANFSHKALACLSKKSPFLGTDFITYLKAARINPSEVHLWLDGHNHLQGFVEGRWAHAILWETICLAIIDEVYFAHHFPALTEEQKQQIYNEAYIKGEGFRARKCYFIEMGTRRRYSKEVQRIVLRGLIDGATDTKTGICYLLGTSNVMLAAEFGLTPQGTMAHEIFSAVAAMEGVENANFIVLDKWAQTFGGLLGVALTDTFTTEHFLRTYDAFHANLYYGLRHDSHKEPSIWTDMVLDHIQALGVDTRTKRLVFSNGIDSFARVDEILPYRIDECLKTFGIGTWFTNDVQHINGAEALNVVMKLVAVKKNASMEWVHACKLSDVAGKAIGDPTTIAEYQRKIYNYYPVPPLEDLVPNYRTPS